jgi:hypothetical protein
MAPSFTPDPAEVKRRASAGCPPGLIELALSCCLENPADRPKMPEILVRLRTIEMEVLSRLSDSDGGEHVGSIRLVHHGGKRAMPIFDQAPAKVSETEVDGDDDDAKMEEDALMTLAGLNIAGAGADGADDTTWRTARWDEQGERAEMREDNVTSKYNTASEMRGEWGPCPTQCFLLVTSVHLLILKAINVFCHRLTRPLPSTLVLSLPPRTRPMSSVPSLFKRHQLFMPLYLSTIHTLLVHSQNTSTIRPRP